ncbi:MAG: class I SAM-dependent methyltransferase [Tenuifilaceae bacterium]|jgi:SAM-dependent methyltransferase|nr:class I SAM-dependent methyltransferase [Tenuifilaceae bacterium]
MRKYFNWYDILISPLLSGLRKHIISQVEVGSTVIEIGCGTGQLAQELLKKGITEYFGVDIAPQMISIARRKVVSPGFIFTDNDFLIVNCDKIFDYAILTMIIHSIDTDIAQKIIRKASTIANKIIIADYEVPQPNDIRALLVRIIEWLAGSEHYYNFKTFKNNGGILFYAHPSELGVLKTISNQVFSIIVLESPT